MTLQASSTTRVSIVYQTLVWFHWTIAQQHQTHTHTQIHTHTHTHQEEQKFIWSLFAILTGLPDSHLSYIINHHGHLSVDFNCARLVSYQISNNLVHKSLDTWQIKRIFHKIKLAPSLEYYLYKINLAWASTNQQVQVTYWISSKLRHTAVGNWTPKGFFFLSCSCDSQ